MACLFLVTAIMLLKLHPIRGNPPNVPAGKAVTLRGKLKERQEKNGSFILTLSNAEIQGEDQTPGKSSVLVYLKDLNKSLSELPPIGSYLSVKGKFSPFESATNPGQFDPKEYYHIRGIEYRLFNASILSYEKDYDLLRENLFLFRLKLSRVYEKLLAPKDSGILKAMILGDRTCLDPDVKSLYQESGIAHALSISSLHISILGYGLYRLLKKICYSRVFPAASCTVFVFLYSLMVGGSTSTIRAVIMFSTCMAADLAGRTYDILSAISLSLMAILFSDPLYIYDPGFTLSFGSVLGIALLTPIFKEALPFGKSRFLAGCVASLSVSFAILPVTLYFFYEIPIFSIFLNLLVVPLMAVLVVSGVFTGLVGLIAIHVALPGALVCHFILFIYEKGCLLMRDLPGSRLIVGRPGTLRIVAYYLLLLLFCLLRKRKPALLFLVLLPILLTARLQNGLTYTMLDIGQGDCNVLNIEGKVMMIDCGSTDLKDIGKYRVLPFLKFYGNRKVDLAVVTHCDADHINGFTEIMERSDESGIRIKNLIMPGVRAPDEKYEAFLNRALESGIRVSFINAGEGFSIRDLSFSCLGPEKDFETEDANEYSTVLKASYGDLSLLFTGDVQGEGEKRMLKHIPPGKRITVLKTAHHGSRFSTPQEFIDMVNPAYSLISAGKNNRYGHPHRELLGRLAKVGSVILVTKDEGAITVRSDGKHLKVSGFLSPCHPERSPLSS